jgi:hypothetical protein
MIFIPSFISLPFILVFNDEFIVVELLHVVFPETFNDDLHVVILLNNHDDVFPDTVNIPKIVVVFDNVVFPETFNDELLHDLMLYFRRYLKLIQM